MESSVTSDCSLVNLQTHSHCVALTNISCLLCSLQMHEGCDFMTLQQQHLLHTACLKLAAGGVQLRNSLSKGWFRSCQHHCVLQSMTELIAAVRYVVTSCSARGEGSGSGEGCGSQRGIGMRRVMQP